MPSTARTSPAPVRKPRFPIWTGGESPAAQKRAAKYADSWFSYFVKISADELGAKGWVSSLLFQLAR